MHNCLIYKVVQFSDLQTFMGLSLNREKTFIGEILIYDGAGLIAQMGGILSLFLGFSFLSIIYGIFDFMEKKLMLSDFKVISLSAGHQEARFKV